MLHNYKITCTPLVKIVFDIKMFPLTPKGGELICEGLKRGVCMKNVSITWSNIRSFVFCQGLLWLMKYVIKYYFVRCVLRLLSLLFTHSDENDCFAENKKKHWMMMCRRWQCGSAKNKAG